MGKVAGILCGLMVLSLTYGGTVLGDDGQTKQERKRAKIDVFTKDSLALLFDGSAPARDLYDRSYGYAVFSNVKIAFGLSAGGGNGVAVSKEDSARTYMRMGTAGIGFGLGGQKYQIVFLFEDQGHFDGFVLNGWQADASAHAVAGKAGKNAASTFTKGLAIYVMSDAGLMLQADVAGTKYWANKRLN